jgi:hypothetical protein
MSGKMTWHSDGWNIDRPPAFIAAERIAVASIVEGTPTEATRRVAAPAVVQLSVEMGSESAILAHLSTRKDTGRRHSPLDRTLAIASSHRLRGFDQRTSCTVSVLRRCQTATPGDDRSCQRGMLHAPEGARTPDGPGTSGGTEHSRCFR